MVPNFNSRLHTEMIQPGQDVDLERVRLGDVMHQLQSGTYKIGEEARYEVQHALGGEPIPEDSAYTDERKVFRNAYAGIIIANAWHPYSGVVTQDLCRLQFDQMGGRSSLAIISPSEEGGTSLTDMGLTIAASNQDVLSHFICAQFAEGAMPVLSGDREKDEEYFHTLKEQTDLELYAGAKFREIPDEAGSPSAFVVSGSLVLRTHVFGLPNLIDDVAKCNDISLSNAQHRRSFLKTMRAAITPYYLPTTPLAVAVSGQLINTETMALDPSAWACSGDPNDFMVYPAPQIVSEVNEEMRCAPQLPIQTNCPAFHGRITTVQAPDVIVPLPRTLPEIALAQLDKWYYPLRAEV